MAPDYKKIIKYLLVLFVSLAVVVFLLNLVGKFFIEEISQPLFVETPKNGDSFGVGKPAPYFELFNLSGKQIRSSDLLGKPAVIVFWNTWGTPSQGEIRIIDGLSGKKDNYFKILAVNSQEDKSQVAGFLERGGYRDIEIALDASGAVSDLYKAGNLPAFYFLDKEGVLREVYRGMLGDTEIVEKISRYAN